MRRYESRAQPVNDQERQTEPVLRWRRGATLERVNDELAVEEPLAIKLDGRTVNITMRTPGHDLELAVGFLLSEGIIRDRRDFSVDESEDYGPNQVNLTLSASVTVDFEKLTRHVFASSSCGLCGKTSIDRVRLPFTPVRPGLEVAAETILALPERLSRNQPTFSLTGGLHAAGVFTAEGELIVSREDIGRHNAVDKVLGWALLNGHLPLERHILLVSGRASFEILQKALAAGFPIIAAISAPSSLAVQFARESRQTLIGFLRNNRMNLYSAPERVQS